MTGKRYINAVEKFVEIAVDDFFLDYKGCKCPICRADIVALTLNHIAPLYVTGDRGAAFAKLHLMDPQVNTDTMRMVVEASKKVQKHPKHE